MPCCPPRNHSAAPAPQSAHFCSSLREIVQHECATIPAGVYSIGGTDADAVPGDGEGPVRTVELSSFSVATTTVTNAQFGEFIKDTGYRTEAEQLGWSFVFHTLVSRRVARATRQRLAEAPWWLAVKDACWRWQMGRGSHVADKPDHPIVHISWNDAQAYCEWSQTRLPTEAEWEAAARGGLAGARYPWGDELTPEGQHRCNIWQGEFPVRDTAEDGFHGTAPVRTYPPNGFALYQVAGNVWEWCQDWFTTDAEPRSGRDPTGPPHGSAKVIRGGSFLCHGSYCNRYRVAARSSNTPNSASSNTGFRVARSG